MTGNPSFCVDAYEQSTFKIIEQIKPKIVFLKAKFLRFDLDLTSLPTIEAVICEGQPEIEIKTAAKIYYTSEIEFLSKNEALKNVHDFESTANKAQFFTYGSTSGSTGPPKIMVYKNAVPMSASKYENDLEASLATVYKV